MTKAERNQSIKETGKKLQKVLKRISSLQDKSFQIDLKIADLVAEREQLDRELDTVLFPEKKQQEAA